MKQKTEGFFKVISNSEKVIGNNPSVSYADSSLYKGAFFDFGKFNQITLFTPQNTKNIGTLSKKIATFDFFK